MGPQEISPPAPEVLFDGPESAESVVVLAHGAGAPMDSPFLNDFARGLGGRGIRVVRFEFPYMRARRSRGGRGAPDREPVLRESWRSTLERLGAGARLTIGTLTRTLGEYGPRIALPHGAPP